MAGSDDPDDAGKAGRRTVSEPQDENAELDRRRRELEASLAARVRPGKEQSRSGNGSASGYSQALRLSSEFIAGIGVGAGLGWVIDRLAGTTPFGLIVFLLLGFGAGVLNVLRAAGTLAEAGIRTQQRDRDTGRDEK